MKCYNTLHRKITNIRDFRNFAQIIGEHGIAMCDLAVSDKNENKRGLMEAWVTIYKLNTEWANRICKNEDYNSEYCVLVRKLISAYSTCLADFILDKHETKEWKKRMTYIVNKETEFFNALGKSKHDAQKEWLAYTACIIRMANALYTDGLNSELYYIEATDVLRTGLSLGQWLDYSLSK